jgi:hypothetical protein
MTNRPFMHRLVQSLAVLALLAQGCQWPPPEEPEPRVCGGLAGLACDAGEFCSFPLEAQCGAADQTGLCAVVPESCTEQYAPVCGCDDRTYDNECFANAAGVSVAREGACEQEGVSCDTRELACLRAAPECPDGQVPQIIDHCFGPCVPIDACLCNEAADCSYPDTYTCHMYRGRCGPYVN